MNTAKYLALCAMLLYPLSSAGQLSGVVPGRTADSPDSTMTDVDPGASGTAESVSAPQEASRAPPGEVSDTTSGTAGAAAQPAPAEPTAAPSAGVEALPSALAPETAEIPAEVPADVSVAVPVETPVADPLAEPASPRAFSAVRPHLVVVRDGIDDDASQASGFSISDQGHILTDSGALRDQDTYLVTVADGQVFSASALKSDEETGLMLIRIAETGHGLAALPFARTALVVAAPLHAIRFNPEETDPFTSVAGSVTQLPDDADETPRIVHNALFNVAGAGTPLLNRCWEAVGANVLQRKGFQQKRIDPIEQGSARSLAASWLSAFLAEAGLSLTVTQSECLSLEEETRMRLEQAAQEKAAALQAERETAEARTQELTEQAQRKEEALNREKEAVQQQLEQTRRETEQALQAEREAGETERARLEEEAQQRLEQAQRDKEQAVQAQRQETEQAREEAGREAQRGRQIVGYSLAIILVLALVFLLVLRVRRKRLQGVEQEKQQIAQKLGQAQADLTDASEREQLRAGAPDVFIEGATPQGERIALKIPGASLLEQDGAVVGRSPADSAFVINHEQVSRRHFRLLLVPEGVMIEDLGSTNGTGVNGLPLKPGDRRALGDGSSLQIGNLVLTARIGP